VLALPTEDISIKTLASGGLYQDEISNVSMLGSSEKVKWTRTPDALTMELRQRLPNLPVIGFKIEKKS